MAGGTHIRNETGLRRILAGTEAVAGTPVTPDYRWYGDLAISKQAALVRTPENTGTYDGLINPIREFPTFSGTYSERLTFQSFAEHNQYAIKAGATGVAAGSGYEYVVSPSATDDDIAAATLQYGVDGQVWRSSGVRHDEYTISMDTDNADNAWMLNSNLFVRDMTQIVAFEGTATGGSTSTLVDTGSGWTTNQFAGAWVFIDFGTGSGEVRQVVSNTADTLTFHAPVLSGSPSGKVYRIEGLFQSGVAFTNYDVIRAQGTKLFIDPVGGTIGDNQILDRLVSFNVSVANTRTTKRFAENVNSYSTRTGRGKRMITGQVRLEFDRRDEYQQYENLDEVMLRFQQTGPALSGTPGDEMSATIDLYRVAWDVVDMDERENNITATFGFVAYLPASDPILEIAVVNDLATLP